MKTRKPLLKTLLARFRKASTEAPAGPRPKAPALRRPALSTIESLEGRIAPATLLNPSTVTFTDLDGDAVTLKFNRNLFVDTLGSTGLQKANAVLKFSTGANAVLGSADSTPMQLQLIDFTTIAASATGVSFSVLASAVGGGNGNADVGAIRATNVALGTVTIDGDLGQVDAGRAGVATALGLLDVGSLGVRGIATQDAGSVPELISTLRGTLGSLKVHGDVKDARVNVINGTAAGGITPLGNIGSVLIEGSLIGRTAVEAASNNTGKIDAVGNIGSVRIGTDATEGIFGGGGENSGQVLASGNLGSVVISGDIRGSKGTASGQVNAINKLTSITVSGQLIGDDAQSSGTIFAGKTAGTVQLGGIIGGKGTSAGSVQATEGITTVTIRNDIVGGEGSFSGVVLASSGSFTTVTVNGDLRGGKGDNSGRIQAGNAINRVTIAEDIVAGEGVNSGGLSAALLGTVSVQDIDGTTVGAGSRSAGIAGARLNSLVVSGSILGGTGSQAGHVEIAGDIGTILVRGSVIGGTGDASGSIIAFGRMTGVTVNGDVIGAAGLDSASIVSGFDPDRVGDMGTVRVLGSVTGGAGDKSASIRSGGAIASLSIGTVGGADALAGGVGDRSGTVESQGLITLLRINGDLTGGAGVASGGVRAFDRFENTGEIAGALGTITITGQLRGGAGVGSGSVGADGNLATLTVGSLNGSTGTDSGSVRTGLGIVQPGTLGAMRVLGALQASANPGANSASIITGGNLTSLTVGGVTSGATIRAADAIGSLNFRDVSDSLITARGQAVQGTTTDLAISSVTVNGSISRTYILAGYRHEGQAILGAVNADAQIGTVTVTGDWSASSLVAGVVDRIGDGFGNIDDSVIGTGGNARIFSRIASIVIRGTVAGTPSATSDVDHYAFTAQQIVRMQVGSFVFPLSVQPLDSFRQSDTPALGATGNDVRVVEEAISI